MTSLNFGQLYTPMSTSSLVLVQMLKYCCQKILVDTVPSDTVMSFIDEQTLSKKVLNIKILMTNIELGQLSR